MEVEVIFLGISWNEKDEREASLEYSDSFSLEE
jgi:hypothetical protein